MSRGVVLWPDESTEAAIREVWTSLSDHGLSSLATHTHRRHRPHCSLSVAMELPAEDALAAVGALPAAPIPFLVESVGVFPPHGALFLACVANEALLHEQRRVHQATKPLATQPWPFFEFNRWVPHITLSMAMSPREFAQAIPLVIEKLPIRGTFESGGVEDGDTGQHWPDPAPIGIPSSR
jgi:hypothetical protein